MDRALTVVLTLGLVFAMLAHPVGVVVADDTSAGTHDQSGDDSESDSSDEATESDTDGQEEETADETEGGQTDQQALPPGQQLKTATEIGEFGQEQVIKQEAFEMELQRADSERGVIEDHFVGAPSSGDSLTGSGATSGLTGSDQVYGYEPGSTNDALEFHVEPSEPKAADGLEGSDSGALAVYLVEDPCDVAGTCVTGTMDGDSSNSGDSSNTDVGFEWSSPRTSDPYYLIVDTSDQSSGDGSFEVQIAVPNPDGSQQGGKAGTDGQSNGGAKTDGGDGSDAGTGDGEKGGALNAPTAGSASGPTAGGTCGTGETLSAALSECSQSLPEDVPKPPSATDIKRKQAVQEAKSEIQAAATQDALREATEETDPKTVESAVEGTSLEDDVAATGDSVAIVSPDGTQIANINDDGKVVKRMQTDAPVTDVEGTDDGKLAVVAGQSNSGTTQATDMHLNKVIEVDMHLNKVIEVATTRDGGDARDLSPTQLSTTADNHGSDSGGTTGEVVATIDPESGAVKDRRPVANSGTHQISSANGNLYIANSGTHEISLVESDDGKVFVASSIDGGIGEDTISDDTIDGGDGTDILHAAIDGEEGTVEKLDSSEFKGENVDDLVEEATSNALDDTDGDGELECVDENGDGDCPGGEEAGDGDGPESDDEEDGDDDGHDGEDDDDDGGHDGEDDDDDGGHDGEDDDYDGGGYGDDDD